MKKEPKSMCPARSSLVYIVHHLERGTTWIALPLMPSVLPGPKLEPIIGQEKLVLLLTENSQVLEADKRFHFRPTVFLFLRKMSG